MEYEKNIRKKNLGNANKVLASVNILIWVN